MPAASHARDTLKNRTAYVASPAHHPRITERNRTRPVQNWTSLKCTETHTTKARHMINSSERTGSNFSKLSTHWNGQSTDATVTLTEKNYRTNRTRPVVHQCTEKHTLEAYCRHAKSANDQQ